MQEILLFLQRHWLLSNTFVIVVAVLLIVEYIRQKRGAKQVSPAQLTQLMNHEDAVVLDVRATSQFEEGHIIGSMSIPLSELKDKMKKLDKLKTRPIIVVCMQGLESARAAEQITTPGMVVHILAGGIRAWREAGMPLVKD